MMNNIKNISVIIPSQLKDIKMLQRVVKKILETKCVNIEEVIIVIPKNQKFILSKHKTIKGKKIKVIRQNGSGLNNARLKGVLNAKNKIVIFIDDDAIPSKDIICKEIEMLTQNKADVVTATKRFDQKSIALLGVVGSKNNSYKRIDIIHGVNFAMFRDDLIKVFKSKEIDMNISPSDDAIIGTIISQKYKKKIIELPSRYYMIHREGNLYKIMKRYFNYGRGNLKYIKWLIKNEFKIHPILLWEVFISMFLLFDIFVGVLWKLFISIIILLIGDIIITSYWLSKFIIKNPIKAFLSSNLIYTLKLFGFWYETLINIKQLVKK